MLDLLAAVVTRLFVALGALAVAGTVGAAENASKGAASQATSGSVLTPAQLRDCLAQRDHLHAQTDDALKDKAAIDADHAKADRLSAELTEQTVTLDKTNADAVAAYNAKIVEREKLVDVYQAKVAAYNVKAEAVKSTRDAYDKSACENRRYDARDLADIQRKK
jgi:hypothetical protein